MGKEEVMDKAKRLVEDDKIHMELMTKKKIHFKVQGDTDTYSVIFNRESESWSCDCVWFSLKKVECSHILAVKLFSDKLTYNGSSPLWDMQVKFVPQSKAIPSKTLLSTALGKLGLGWGDIPKEDKIKDDYGIFCINLPEFVLCAKEYVMSGTIVSSHKRAVVSAYNQKKPLIMYLDEGEHFYKFSPDEILKDSFMNFKGTAKMLNWKISLGEKVILHS